MKNETPWTTWTSGEGSGEPASNVPAVLSAHVHRRLSRIADHAHRDAGRSRHRSVPVQPGSDSPDTSHRPGRRAQERRSRSHWLRFDLWHRRCSNSFPRRFRLAKRPDPLPGARARRATRSRRRSSSVHTSSSNPLGSRRRQLSWHLRQSWLDPALPVAHLRRAAAAAETRRRMCGWTTRSLRWRCRSASK